jgi:flagellin-like hook-associated protein FlgL
MAILPLQLARVSNQLRTSIAQQTISRTQNSLLQVQNELATGKRLNAPSDDPGDAAIVQQLRKTLEQREGYQTNLRQATSHLSEVDSTLGDITDLLKQAQTLASANVGSEVSADERIGAAAIAKSLYSQMLNLANRQFGGVYLFAGDRATDAPFVEEGGGIKFVGSNRVLENTYDEDTRLPFMVDGDQTFGALSTRVEGTEDLTPAMSDTTRLTDLNGATDDGVRLGTIRLGNGTTTALIDLTDADTIGDVRDAINAAGVGTITASIAPDGVSLRLTGGAGDDITVQDVGGGKTAADLGILLRTGAGAGTPLAGDPVGPKLTLFTRLDDLKGGVGIDRASGITITNGLLNATISFSAWPLDASATVEDMLNVINGSGTAVRAEINAAGTGINILNPTQGTLMTISENGGTTAADLGVRSFSASAELADLNFGKGVATANGNDIQLVDTAGVTFEVDLTGLTTVQDVIDAINTAATGAGAGVTASFKSTGNGIILTDTAGGVGTLAITPINFSEAASDLGLLKDSSGGVITGDDVHQVKATGVFSHLAKLRDSLLTSDQRGITEAAEGLTEDFDRIVRVRGEAGARVQEL